MSAVSDAWAEAVSNTAEDLGVRIAAAKIDDFAQSMHDHASAIDEVASYGRPSSYDVAEINWQPKVDAAKSEHESDRRRWSAREAELTRSIEDLRYRLRVARSETDGRRG